MKIVLYGNPRTKKNSQQIIYNKVLDKPMLIQNKLYLKYEKDCLKQLKAMKHKCVGYKCNVECVYYRDSERRVDLNNLLEATTDILVKGRVLEDDNFKIIHSHNGSCVKIDKTCPRVEIDIERVEE